MPQPDVTQVTVQNRSMAISQDAALTASGNYDVPSAFELGSPPAVVIEDTTSATESPADPVHSCTKSADFKNVWSRIRLFRVPAVEQPVKGGTVYWQALAGSSVMGGSLQMWVTGPK